MRCSRCCDPGVTQLIGSDPCVNNRPGSAEHRQPISVVYVLYCDLFLAQILVPAQELMPFMDLVSIGGVAVVRRQNLGFIQLCVVVWLGGSPELLSSQNMISAARFPSRRLLSCRSSCPSKQWWCRLVAAQWSGRKTGASCIMAWLCGWLEVQSFSAGERYGMAPDLGPF